MPAQWVVKRQEFFSPTGTAKQAELNQICCKAGALSWRKVQTSNPGFLLLLKWIVGTSTCYPGSWSLQLPPAPLSPGSLRLVTLRT